MKISDWAKELSSAVEPSLAIHVPQIVSGTANYCCRIAMVGQVKAGKSSFINALTGRPDLLPTHVNPWTAVVTRLHFGVQGAPTAGAEFSFFTPQEWDELGEAEEFLVSGTGHEMVEAFKGEFEQVKRRAELRLGTKFHHLLGKRHYFQSLQPDTLQNYICAGPPVRDTSREIKPGRYADITKTAHVYLPMSPFALPTMLIDTPGTNDPTYIRLRTTRDVIDGADIFVCVLTARQPLASADLDLLRLLHSLDNRRFVIFINRIDDLDEPADEAPRVVEHVRSVMTSEFGMDAIPIVAGSAKWAMLSAIKDEEALLSIPGRHAFEQMASRTISLASLAKQNDGVSQLRFALRAASGLDAVADVISTAMLASFLASEAWAIAKDLLPVAELSVASAHKQVASITALINEVQKDREFDEKGMRSYLSEIEKVLKLVTNAMSSAREEYSVTIAQGQAKLSKTLDSTIEAFASTQKHAVENLHRERGAAVQWKCDVAPLRKRLGEDFERVTSETMERLAKIQNAVVAFQSNALAETYFPGEDKASPSGATAPSIAPPPGVLDQDVSVDLDMTRWRVWLGRPPAPKKAEELRAEIIRQFAPMRDRLIEAAEQALNTFATASVQTLELTAARPFQNLAQGVRAFIDGEEQRRHQEYGQRLAAFVAEYDEKLNRACMSEVVCKRIVEDMRAVQHTLFAKA